MSPNPDDQVPSVRRPAPLPDGVSQATIGVRGGLLRSGFEETAEAMYLTSGYVYSSAAEAEKAFTGDIDRYVYSRYGNPTISMFEERLRLIEGAPACFATATGMAAWTAAVSRPAWPDSRFGDVRRGLSQAIRMVRPRGSVFMKSTLHGKAPIGFAQRVEHGD